MARLKRLREFKGSHGSESLTEGKEPESSEKQFVASVITAADNAKDALRGPIFDFDEEVQKEKEAKELSVALHKALKEVSSLYDKAVEAHKKMK